MTKARKISLVVLSCFMLLCCCTLFAACESSKSVSAISLSNAPVSVSAYDPAVNGSLEKYKEEVLSNFSVTLTYADNSTETFTGLDQLNKNNIRLNNFILGQKGTYTVTVYCGKVSATFEMTVS